MPFARLTVIPAPDLGPKLAADLTDLISHDLEKRHDLTSVLVETPGPGLWTIGAVPTAAAAHLEVWVTAGTNSESEKQQFVANAMALLRQALPGLARATYVVVTELPATNWGYDGRTQADRAQHPA